MCVYVGWRIVLDSQEVGLQVLQRAHLNNVQVRLQGAHHFGLPSDTAGWSAKLSSHQVVNLSAVSTPTPRYVPGRMQVTWIWSVSIKRRYPNTTTISQGICWWKGDTMMNNNTNTTFCVSQGKTVCLFFLSQIWSEGYTWLSCIPGWNELKVWPHQYIYRLYTGWVRCHKSWLPPHRFNRYLNCTRALKQLFVVPPTQCQKWVKPFLAD